LLLDDRIDTSDAIPPLPIGIYSVLRTSRRGYGNAIAEGIENLKGSFFALMNSDDLVHPNKFINQIRDLQRENADLSVGKIIKFNDTGKIISQSLGYLTNSNYNSRVLLLGAYGADATWCGRTEKIKSWEFSNELAADWITAFTNFPNSKIVYSPNAFYFYRQHKNQITMSQDFKVSSFEKIYKSWNFMNTQQALMSLTEEAAKLIAAPWLIQKKSKKEEIKDATRWLKEFDHRSNGEFRKLVNRRYVYLLFRGFYSRIFLFAELRPALLGTIDYFLEKISNNFHRIRFNKFLDLK
jgi:glycosyltransferase involved in cell wall biosynthesis